MHNKTVDKIRLYGIGSQINYLTSFQARVISILATTALGAAWLFYKGTMPVICITTPLPETVPFWYMLSAFIVLGMLLADLMALYAIYGFKRRFVEIGLQIGFLILISNFRLAFKLPVSGHALLFAYFALRRMLIRFPANSVRWVELILAIVMYIIISYAKLAWWFDPVTLASGTIMAVGLSLISLYVWRGIKQKTLTR